MLPKLPRPNLVPAIDSSPPLSSWYLHLSMITVGWSRPAIRRFRTLPFAASHFSQSLTRFSQWTGPAWNIQESGRYLKGSDFPTNVRRRLLPYLLITMWSVITLSSAQITTKLRWTVKLFQKLYSASDIQNELTISNIQNGLTTISRIQSELTIVQLIIEKSWS